MSAHNTAIVQVHDLSLAYARGPEVLSIPEESIPAGAVVSLVGPNGGGKTTLLRCVAGLLRPARGTVRIHDRPIYGSGAISRMERALTMAVVLTERVVPAYLRVRELVALGRIPHRQTERPGDSGAAVQHALEATGAEHLADRMVSHLSDGERQRVMIARAMAQEPAVLLLDEPASHLDPPHQTGLFQLLRQLVADSVIESAVVATHYLHLAVHFSDVLFLVAGGTVTSGHPCELFDSGQLQEAFSPYPDSLTLDADRGWFVPVDQK